MMRFNWTPTRLTKLRKLSKTHTMQQAADEIGCTQSTIQSRSRIEGISFRKYGERHHSSKYSDKKVEVARLLVEQGSSIAQSSRATGIPLHAVSEYCNFKYRNNDAIQRL